MSAIVYKQLSDVPMERIHEAWINAFADYPVPVSTTVQELRYMLERRGYEPTLSMGAYDEDKLVGFILNGIRDWQGKLTAYDTGTGLVKAYRRRGIATRLFEESLPVLRASKVEQYLLEVLKPNIAAYDLYLKKGFEVIRQLDCYLAPISDIQCRTCEVGGDFQLIQVDEPDWDTMSSFWDFSPSWQNSVDSVEQKWDHLTALGFRFDGKLVAYGLVENETGDIPQLAVHKSYRRKGLATALFENLISHSKSGQARIINAEEDYQPFKAFLNSVQLTPDIGQYEMLMML